eukprot:110933_1
MAICENLITCIYASTWIGLIMFFIVPFEIYATIKFYKYQYHPGIQTRYPMIVISAAIFSMIHSLICDTFYYLQFGVNVDILNTKSSVFSAHIIFPPFLLIVSIIIAFRIYLIHFNTKYAVIQSTLDWQSLLSDSVQSNDFYSRNRKTYGNWKYVIRYFILYGICASILEITVSILEHPKLLNISHTISKIIYVLCVFPVVLCIAYLYLKTPKFDDTYFVRKELKYLTFLFLFCVLLYIIASALTTDSYPIFADIATNAITIVNFGQVVISEYIICNKIMADDDSGIDYRFSTFMLQSISSFHSNNNATSKNNKLIPSSILFKILLATNIDIFVKHLRYEFSSENAFSLIELIQWLYLSTNKEFDKYDIKPLEKIDFELCEIIPISSANSFHNNKNEWKWEESIILIYEKYIDSSAELQVNLPYENMIAWNNLIYLLKMKQELENKTYIFKHKPIPIKPIKLMNKLSFSFWGKSSNKSNNRKPAINMLTIPENTNVKVESVDEQIKTIEKINASLDQINASSQQSKSKSSKTNTKSTKNKQSKSSVNMQPPIGKITASDGSVVELTETEWNTQQNNNELTIEDVDELVIVDEDYQLYAMSKSKSNKECVDPEISSTVGADIIDMDTNRTASLRTDTNRTVSFRMNTITSSKNDTNTNSIRTNSLKLDINTTTNKSNLKPPVVAGLKLNNSSSVIHSVKKLFKKITTPQPSTPSKSIKDNNAKINDLYVKEWEEVEKAKKLELNEFVKIVCQSMHIILQLNYQSVSRFKRSKQYGNFIQSVNLQNLIEKYGNK